MSPLEWLELLGIGYVGYLYVTGNLESAISGLVTGLVKDSFEIIGDAVDGLTGGMWDAILGKDTSDYGTCVFKNILKELSKLNYRAISDLIHGQLAYDSFKCVILKYRELLNAYDNTAELKLSADGKKVMLIPIGQTEGPYHHIDLGATVALDRKNLDGYKHLDPPRLKLVDNDARIWLRRRFPRWYRIYLRSGGYDAIDEKGRVCFLRNGTVRCRKPGSPGIEKGKGIAPTGDYTVSGDPSDAVWDEASQSYIQKPLPSGTFHVGGLPTSPVSGGIIVAQPAKKPKPKPTSPIKTKPDYKVTGDPSDAYWDEATQSYQQLPASDIGSTGAVKAPLSYSGALSGSIRRPRY